MFVNENNLSGLGDFAGKKQRDRWKKALIGTAVIGAAVYGAKKFGVPKVSNVRRTVPSMAPTITGQFKQEAKNVAVSSGNQLLSTGVDMLKSKLSPQDMSLPEVTPTQEGQTQISTASMFGGIPPIGIIVGLSVVGLIATKLLK